MSPGAIHSTGTIWCILEKDYSARVRRPSNTNHFHRHLEVVSRIDNCGALGNQPKHTHPHRSHRQHTAHFGPAIPGNELIHLPTIHPVSVFTFPLDVLRFSAHSVIISANSPAYAKHI
jgi:hypothetical protein